MIIKLIAVIIGLVMVIERLVLLAYPKLHKKAWREIAKSPDSSVRLIGAIFLAIGAFLILLALKTSELSEVVVIAAAGWCLFLGSYAFAAKPLKSALNAFPKVDKRLIQLGNLLVLAAGVLIVYFILK